MHWRAATGATPLQHLSAHCAEPAANRIGDHAVRLVKITPVQLVQKVRGTARVGAEPCAWIVTNCLPCHFRRMVVFFKTDAKLLRKPFNRLGRKLCSITLLKHRQRRLPTADLGGNCLLRKLCRAPRHAEL